MKALVTGANGFIGSHLCDALLAAGHAVRGLVRASSDLAWLEDKPVELARGELRDQASLERAAAGMDWVFHAAATVRPSDPADFERVNYEGTRVLAEACRRAGVRRFVLLSSAAAAGPAAGPDRPVTEDDPVQPVSRYGRGKLRAEQALVELRERLHSVILRLPAVYGPRDRNSLVLLRGLARGVRPVLPGSFSLVYVADVAQAALLAAQAEVPSGSVYFISDGGCYDHRTLGRLVAGMLGRRGVGVPVPKWVIRSAAAVSEWLQREGAIFNRDKARELVQDCWACSPQRAMAELGYRPGHELERGMRVTIDWYRERNWI
ncbi:NAD-dependent epimerase/dehydratase family protein [candidate division WOR-3 bacterium]|nr:NAD-dependent epimerase/dehydratase family protein [candidate division WOR-3 bacterium]